MSEPTTPQNFEDQADRLNQEILPFLEQEDWLRILIQGHAKIERLLDQAIREEFDVEELPREVKSLGFPRRTVLARGLKIIRPETKSMVSIVADVRHTMAHDVDKLEMTPVHLNQLRQVIGDEVDASGFSSLDLVRFAIALTWSSLVVDVLLARLRRLERDEALAAHRERRFARGRSDLLKALLNADPPFETGST